MFYATLETRNGIVSPRAGIERFPTMEAVQDYFAYKYREEAASIVIRGARFVYPWLTLPEYPADFWFDPFTRAQCDVIEKSGKFLIFPKASVLWASTQRLTYTRV